MKCHFYNKQLVLKVQLLDFSPTLSVGFKPNLTHITELKKIIFVFIVAIMIYAILIKQIANFGDIIASESPPVQIKRIFKYLSLAHFWNYIMWGVFF